MDLTRFHKKLNCKYCKDDKVYFCATCNGKMDCKKASKCKMCGGVYCRPKTQPISAGLLTLDLTTDEPFLWLVRESTGTINDSGGKVDSDIDLSHLHTVFREIKEEQGRLILSQLYKLPYIDLKNKTYRCYIDIHTNFKPAFISASSKPELEIVKMPVSELLNGGDNEINGRLLVLLNSPVKRAGNITLKKYLISKSHSADMYDLISKTESLSL